MCRRSVSLERVINPVANVYMDVKAPAKFIQCWYRLINIEILLNHQRLLKNKIILCQIIWNRIVKMKNKVTRKHTLSNVNYNSNFNVTFNFNFTNVYYNYST